MTTEGTSTHGITRGTWLRAIERAAGSYRCTEAQPCGLSAYYDAGQMFPWRIADDGATESYRTPEAAELAAAEWAAEMFEGVR